MNLTTTDAPSQDERTPPETEAQEVHELLTVYLSRSDIPKKNGQKQQPVAGEFSECILREFLNFTEYVTLILNELFAVLQPLCRRERRYVSLRQATMPS